MLFLPIKSGGMSLTEAIFSAAVIHAIMSSLKSVKYGSITSVGEERANLSAVVYL